MGKFNFLLSTSMLYSEIRTVSYFFFVNFKLSECSFLRFFLDESDWKLSEKKIVKGNEAHLE